MGTKYCKPVRDTPEALDSLQSKTMLEVRTKLGLMSRMFQKKGYYFFSNDELRQVFSFTDEQVYLVLSLFSSNAHINRVGSLDLWCALALTASGSSEEKIAFGFKLVDSNNDDFVSHNELLLLFICATRGASSLKGLLPVPEKTIDKAVLRAFELYRKDLNEHGEISLKSVTEYLLTSETCRSYLAGLGAKLPPVDTGAMVQKRANILKELASLRYQIDEIICEVEDAQEHLGVQQERGGDVELLRIGELPSITTDHRPNTAASSMSVSTASAQGPLVVDAQKEHQSDIAASSTQQSRPHSSQLFNNGQEMPRPMGMSLKSIKEQQVDLATLLQSDEQTLESEDTFDAIKIALGTGHPVNKYYGYDDSWIGEIYNKPRPYLDKDAKLRRMNSTMPETEPTPEDSRPNIYGPVFEDQLLREWKKIPQESDLMIEIDEFTLKCMFEQLNVSISFYLARQCLAALPRNQLHQVHFYDMLQWIRKHYVDRPVELNPHQNHSSYTQSWFNYLRQMKDGAHSLRCQWSTLWSTIAKQRRIVTGISNAQEVNFTKKLAEFRAVSAKKPTIVQIACKINPNRNEVYDNDDETSISKKINALDKQKDDTTAFGTKLRIHWMSKPFTNLSTRRPKESTRLQRQQDCGRSFVLLQDSLGFDSSDALDYMNILKENEWIAAKEAEAIAIANAAAAMEESSRVSNENGSTRGGNISEKLRRDISRRNSSYVNGYDQQKIKRTASLLDVAAKALATASVGETPTEYASVSWIAVDVRKDIDDTFAHLLQQSLQTLFESIPLSMREHLYTTVYSEICTLEGETEEDGKKKKKKKKRSSMIDRLVNTVLGKMEEEKVPVWKQGRTVVLVLLLHEDDHFMALEKSLLEVDLFCSRWLLQGDIELELDQTPRELFDHSLKFAHFAEKLFGPQEEELGEEGCNPLRFAKDIRQKKKQLKDLQAGLKQLSREELQQHCRLYGRIDTGTTGELFARVQTILTERQQLIGIGELSEFGKEVVKNIFDRYNFSVLKSVDELTTPKKNNKSPFDSRNPSRAQTPWKQTSQNNVQNLSITAVKGMPLWEFNNLLHSVGSKTLYDREEFQTLLRDHEMLADKDGNCMQQALVSFFERHGKLAQDIRRLSEGSLDSLLTGRVSVNAAYDAEALQSVSATLFAMSAGSDSKFPASLMISPIEKLLSSISAVKEFKFEGELSKLSELINRLPFGSFNADTMKHLLLQCASTPGGLSSMLSAVLGKWCDGKDGLLPVLRQIVTDRLGLQRDNKDSNATTAKNGSHDPKTDDRAERTEIDITEEVDTGANHNTDPAMSESVEREQWASFDQAIASDFLRQVQLQVATELDSLRDQWRQEDEQEAEEAAKALEEEANRLHILGAGETELAEHETKTKQAETQALARQLEKQQDRLKLEWAIKDRIAQSTAKQFVSWDFLSAQSKAIDNRQPFAALDSKLREDPRLASRLKENEDWPTIREHLVEEMMFLQSLRKLPGFTLSLDESIAVEGLKAQYLQLLQDLHEAEYDHYKRWATHFLVAYDLLRLTSSGMWSMGFGTRDFCVRVQMDYEREDDTATRSAQVKATEGGAPSEVLNNFPEPSKDNLFAGLPEGKGELVFLKELEQEKYRRFERRRLAAIAALERERLRRTMNEDDHERLRLQKLEAQRLVYEKEEKGMFEKAFSQLLESRESRKSSNEISALAKAFESICILKEQRFPDDFGVHVARNNAACVLLEVYGIEHPLSEPAEFFLRDAVERILKAHQLLVLKEKEKKFKEYTKQREEELKAHAQSQEQMDQPPGAGSEVTTVDESHGSELTLKDMEVDVPIANPAPSAMIIVNYIHLLTVFENEIALRNALETKLYFDQCFELMSEKDQQRLVQSGLVGDYRNIPVFTATKDPSVVIASMREEAAYYTKKKKAVVSIESASATQSAAEASGDPMAVAAEPDDDDKSILSAGTDSTRTRLHKRNLFKRLKSEQQRQRDNRMRAESSKQRKFLYDLIQSDQISKIFAAKAGSNDKNAPVVVSTTEDQELLFNASTAFTSMAAMSTHEGEN